jgi:hypothetical protein
MYLSIRDPYALLHQLRELPLWRKGVIRQWGDSEIGAEGE